MLFKLQGQIRCIANGLIAELIDEHNMTAASTGIDAYRQFVVQRAWPADTWTVDDLDCAIAATFWEQVGEAFETPEWEIPSTVSGPYPSLIPGEGTYAAQMSVNGRSTVMHFHIGDDGTARYFPFGCRQ